MVDLSPYALSIKRSARKSISLQLKSPGLLELRVPQWLKQTQIQQWLLQQETEIRQYLAALPQPQTLQTGSAIYFQGQAKKLVLRPDIARAALYELEIHCPQNNPEAKLEALFKQQAKLIFQSRYDRQWQRVLDWGIEKPSLHIRKMKTRWGSCSSLGRINLSLGLLAKPASCLDYVICHEISHLREFNHGPGFYKIQEYLVPDWKEQKALLEKSPDNSGLLSF